MKGVVGAFAHDQRVLGWDIWNEPDNMNRFELRKGRARRTRSNRVLALLPKAFEWARAAGATQPLTSGVWKGDWSSRTS